MARGRVGFVGIGRVPLQPLSLERENADHEVPLCLSIGRTFYRSAELVGQHDCLRRWWAGGPPRNGSICPAGSSAGTPVVGQTSADRLSVGRREPARDL